MRWLAIAFLLFPNFVWAQSAATLVADSVILNGEDQLIAQGNVEALYQGTKLSAERIVYDQASDRLTISGPIVIQVSDGTVLLADQADLDPTLESGLLVGARLVLNQQLQIVANQIDRKDGRYSQLYKTAATSCYICGDGPPLWEIRAERVIHDQQARQLYFDNAVFRVKGVPVLWMPRMRLPDPSLNRSNGFLVPKQRNTTQLGTGFKFPYFVTLGNHRDITITPYLSPETRTLELSYRQAFANGDFNARGAVTDDTLEPTRRSYLFADGTFRFASNYQLSFDVEAVNDESYLSDYSFTDKDRLDSAVSLLRVTDDALTQANLTYYQTLRDDEENSSLPPIVADLSYEKRVQTRTGGQLRLGGSIDTAYRYSDLDGTRGRDVTRAGAIASLEQQWVLPGGILANLHGNLRAEAYQVADDAAFNSNDIRIVPGAALTLRWPWAMTTTAGTSHLIEPAVQIATTRAFGDTPPNEDSTRNEFDEGNLFDMSRFAGEDAVEDGSQLTLGLSWSRFGTNGTTSRLTFGQVTQTHANTNFTPASGLDGTTSDLLIAGQIIAPGGFVFDARALLKEDGDPTRAASLIAWKNNDLSLSAAYIWQAPDAERDQPDTLSEWTLDMGLNLSDAWTVNIDARYDVAQDRPVRAGIGVEWRNECVTIDVSASRRYSSSSIVEPTTTFGLSGAINGFSAGRSRSSPSARCGN